MKSKRILLASLVCCSLFTAYCDGAAFVTLFVDSGSTRELRNQSAAPLFGGSSGIDGDGAVVQIGYFTDATAGNNFGNGNFVPLSGEGSLFNVSTTVGDSVNNGGDTGTLFSDALNIFAGLNGGANDGLFPAVDTPLSIRIFNNTTIAASTFYEAISNNLWKWKAPSETPPVVQLFLDSAGLVAKSGTNVAPTSANIQTNTQIVPEPTSAALIMVGMLSLAARRRRQAI